MSEARNFFFTVQRMPEQEERTEPFATEERKSRATEYLLRRRRSSAAMDRVLLALADASGPTTMSSLGEKTELPFSSLTKTLSELSGAGHARFIPSEIDQGPVRVELTQSGHDFLVRHLSEDRSRNSVLTGDSE